MTYTRTPDGYTLTTEHGTFTGDSKQQVNLKALIAENDARHRHEVSDREREIAREAQADALAFTDNRRGGR